MSKPKTLGPSTQSFKINIPQKKPTQPNNIQKLISGTATGVQDTAKNITDLINKSGITRNNNAAKLGGIVQGIDSAVPASAQGVDTSQGVPDQQEESQNKGLDPQVRDAYNELITPVKQGGQGMSPSEAEKYLTSVYGISFGSDGVTKTTESQKKFIAAGQQAQAALDILQSGGASTGKIANVGNKISQFLGTQNSVQTDYNSKLAAARGSAISALSGANVPPSEYERIADMIPVMTDEPQIAEQKLKSFAEAMNVYANAGT